MFEIRNLFIFRGIDIVRNKIKMFAQKKVTLPKGRQKIIILDEADRLVMFCYSELFCLLCRDRFIPYLFSKNRMLSKIQI